MKKKVVNSQLSNYKTYLMYFRRMLSLAENVFEFENVPNTFIDISYINRKLVRSGSIAFFKDEELGLIALPYNVIGRLDVYGRPRQIEVYGDNSYRRILKQDEFVIMYDNTQKFPLIFDISQMAERMALCVRTNDINLVHQRTPRIWKTPQDKVESLKKTLDEIDSMTEDVVGYDGNEIADMNVILAPAPYVVDKIDQHIHALWAEFYSMIGVANLQEQKRERVIIDEMVASQGGTIAARFSRFEPRERAIREINEKFGTEISVHYYDGEPDSKKGDNEDVRDVSDRDDKSDDSEFDETQS